MQLTVHVDKAYSGSAIARIYMPGCEMVLVMPEGVMTRAQGFDIEMQKKIIRALRPYRDTMAEKAINHNYEIEIEI